MQTQAHHSCMQDFRGTQRDTHTFITIMGFQEADNSEKMTFSSLLFMQTRRTKTLNDAAHEHVLRRPE